MTAHARTGFRRHRATYYAVPRHDLARRRWTTARRLGYAVAEVVVGLAYLLGIPVALWLAATR